MKDEGFKKTIQEAKNDVKGLQEELNVVGKEAKKMANDNGRAWKLFGDSLKPADTRMGQFQRSLAGVDKNFGGLLSKMGVSIPQFAKMAGGIGLAVAAGGAFIDFSQKAVVASAEFGKSISELGAITGASGDDLERLRGMIQNLGKDMNVSSKEVAGNFAQIGSALPELLKDADGLEAVSKSAIILSKAGVMPLADATDALTVSMAQFDISADESSNVIDVLANAAQKGSAGIKEVAETLQRAGTMANAAGVNITEAAAATEVLASKGLKGAEAGTALKGVFSKMQTSGIDELNPKVVGMSKALEYLQSKGEDTTWMVQTFGESAASAAQILANNVDMYKELSAALGEVGTAESMAKKNTDNLASDWKAMQTQWENLLSSFNMDGNNPLRGVVQEITEIIKVVGEWFDVMGDDPINEALGKIDLNPLQDVLGVFTDLIRTLKSLDESLGISDRLIMAFQEAWAAVGVVMKVVREIIFWVEAAIAAVGKMIGWCITKVREFISNVTTSVSSFPLFEKLNEWIDWIIGKLKTLIEWYRKVRGEAQEMMDAKVGQPGDGKEEKKDKPKDKPNTPTTPTTTTTTPKGGGKGGGSTTVEKDPIKEAEEKYANTIRKLAQQEEDGYIEHEKAEEGRMSALQALIDTYYDQKKLTDKQRTTLKRYLKSLDKAKSSMDRTTDNILYSTALNNQSKSVQMGRYQNQMGYITDEELRKIEEDANDELIKALFQLKLPTEEQTKLLQELINQQKLTNKVRQSGKIASDKINLSHILDGTPTLGNMGEKLIKSATADVEANADAIINAYKKKFKKRGIEISDEMLEAIKSDILADAIIEAFQKSLEKLRDGGKSTGHSKPSSIQNRGDDSNIALNNISYQRLSKETENYLKQPKTLGNKAQFNLEELEKALEKYQQIEDIITEINNKHISEDGAFNPDEIITYSEELAQLEGQIERLRKKAKRDMNFQLGMDGMGDVLSGISSIESFAESLTDIGDRWENASNGLEKFGIILNTLVSTFQTIQTVMTIVNGLQTLFGITAASNAAATQAQVVAQGEKSAADGASVAAATAATVALHAQEEAALGLAAAEIMAAHAAIPFAGVAIGSGQVSAMLGAFAGFRGAIAALAAFQNGGIVGGSSFSGDNTLIRANSGEMVLNQGQQSNLFKMINDGITGGSGVRQVEFVIKGQNLRGVLKNNDSKYSKLN